MVKIEHEGKTYSLTNVGGTPTWVDHRNIIVAVELQSRLRGYAIAQGVDQAVFKVEKDVKKPVKKTGSKRTRKKKESLGVKLFN